MKAVITLCLVLLAGLAAAEGPKPLQVTFPPPVTVPSPPPPAATTPPPLPTFQAPGLDFSLIIPGFTTSSFNTNQQQALCAALTSNWNSSSTNRGASCTVGSVSSFNGTTNVLVSGYAFFTWSSAPSVTDLQTATALRDARVVALTTNVTSVLGSSFPAAVPNCACDGVGIVTAFNTVAFAYTTNITGVPGPMQCAARLTYDNSNEQINQVGVDDGSSTFNNLGKYCSTPAVSGGVAGVPGSGSCRQYGVIASADGTTQATATAVITSGVVTGTILTGGSGYTSTPTVTVSAPSPIAAQVTYTLNTAFQPTAFTLSSASNGPYTAAPSVASLANTCVDTGNTGSNPANTCTGTQLTYQVNGISRTGARCEASDISAAQLDPSGSVISSAGLAFPNTVTIYCTTAPSLVLNTNTLQAAVTAQITAAINSGTGVVSSLSVISPGSGYRTAPTITISAPSSDSIGKLCGPAPIAALPASIGYTQSRTITSNGQCQPLGRDTYSNKVCSVPAAPAGEYSPINSFTCNVGRLGNCPTTKYINLAAANSAPTPRLAGSSWKNRIIPVDASKDCNVVWIQAAGDNLYAGKYLGYGSCSSQTAFRWESASSSSGIQWKLNRA